VVAGAKVEAVERLGAATTRRALAWMAHHRDRPFFMLVHYFDAHGPHMAPPPYDRLHDPDYTGDRTVLEYFQSPEVRQRIIANPRQVQYIKAQYDGEISYVDAEVGRVLDELRALGLSDNTLVIFTADHGESLTEHDFYFDHGEYLYETCVRVPLLMRFPDRRYAGRRQPGQVRLVDLAPTILAVAGVRAPAGDGVSLLPLLDGTEPAGERISVGSLYAGRGEDARARYYVRAGGYKLIWSFDRRADLSDRPALEELYDLTTDPGEVHNLSASAPPVLDDLRKRMQVWRREQPSSRHGPEAGVHEQLRQLGYE